MRRRRLSGLPYTLAMGAAKQVRPLTLEEHLALEREAPVKHELVEGFPHAMATAGDRAALNLALPGLDRAPPFPTPRPQPVLP